MGNLEQLVLTAVLRQNGTGYGVSIGDELEKRTERTYSLGALYSTLDRLEQKKYVKSRVGEPTPERGGRRKRLFEITGLGQAALENAWRVSAAMSRGLPGLHGAKP